MVSETCCGDLSPEAVKLNQFSEIRFEFDKAALDRIAGIMLEYPYDQLYVIFGHKRDMPSVTATKRERELFNILTAAGLDESRITLIRIEENVEIVQFWRVPPGADPPQFDECEDIVKSHNAQGCPSISLVGPEGITKPGEFVRVAAKLSQLVFKEREFRWSVSAGEIIIGQNSQSISVKTDGLETQDGVRIMVKVEVLGLPPGCNNFASDEYLVHSGNYDFFPVDEYGEVAFNEEKARLDNLAITTLAVKDMRGYIVKTFTQNTSERNIKSKIGKLKTFMFNFRRYPRDRFVFLVRRSDRNSTILWRFPVNSAERPCDDCWIQ